MELLSLIPWLLAISCPVDLWRRWVTSLTIGIVKFCLWCFLFILFYLPLSCIWLLLTTVSIIIVILLNNLLRGMWSDSWIIYSPYIRPTHWLLTIAAASLTVLSMILVRCLLHGLPFLFFLSLLFNFIGCLLITWSLRFDIWICIRLFLLKIILKINLFCNFIALQFTNHLTYLLRKWHLLLIWEV